VSEVRNWNVLETRFASAVKLKRRPVAVAYLERAPDSVEKFVGSEPSGCSFWRLAADGRTFYTVPEDHFNCAVGAYTHNITLSPEREQETGVTLKMMFDLGYVKPEEVPQIPRLAKTPAVVVYSPLGEAPVAPDVVLFACQPRSAMLLNEAANRAGVASGAPALGRPTCMALPASLQHGAIFSLGCIRKPRVHGSKRRSNVLRGARAGSASDCRCSRSGEQRRCCVERLRDRPTPKALDRVIFLVDCYDQ